MAVPNQWILVLGILVFAQCASAAAAFADDFGTDRGGWEAVRIQGYDRGAYNISGGAMTVSSAPYKGATAVVLKGMGANGSDYAVDVNVRARSEAHLPMADTEVLLGVMYANRDALQGVAVTPYGGGGYMAPHYGCVLEMPQTRRTFAWDPAGACVALGEQVQSNRWYHLTFEKNGQAVRGYLDGQLLMEKNITAEDARAMAYPFFMVFEGVVEFDDFGFNESGVPSAISNGTSAKPPAQPTDKTAPATTGGDSASGMAKPNTTDASKPETATYGMSYNATYDLGSVTGAQPFDGSVLQWLGWCGAVAALIVVLAILTLLQKGMATVRKEDIGPRCSGCGTALLGGAKRCAVCGEEFRG